MNKLDNSPTRDTKCKTVSRSRSMSRPTAIAQSTSMQAETCSLHVAMKMIEKGTPGGWDDLKWEINNKQVQKRSERETERERESARAS